ncbi:divergent polysaccharide deacetylase family protein [Pararhizobium gei]|uniref:divergent polysaccharide deacetylase family protein n=1 Tax=Pararhizobium gei TaxID=1395951 RepID=UPI0023DA1726|nr:divergent polysaccharide deacetylase family protein [Rhizobium gei]
MGTDLNAPLGQNRKSPTPPRSRFSVGKGLFALGAIGLIVVSAWVAFRPTGLIEPAPQTIADASPPEELGEKAGPVENLANRPQTSGPLSGANVEKTVNSDGSIVTKFSPQRRDGDGPAFIEVGRTRGQDPRLAAVPNDMLLEDAPEGRLPIIASDGFRPLDQYARPWSGARGTRIALVIGGLGLSQTGTQKALQELPPEMTLAFAATGNSLQRWMQEARRKGHEILLQIPFEPFDYPANDPGPNTLRVDAGSKKNLSALHTSLAKISNYTGIMNFLGGRFLADADALEPIMRDIGRRGLLFLDDGTSARSLTGTLAEAIGVPYGFADMVVDTELDRTAILKKLDELERVARRNGSAIGVASAFDESVAAIAQWTGEASGRGIEFVGVSALVKDPQQQ